MPERYGKDKTAHKRFTRRAAKGVWDAVFANLIKDRGNEYLMIDSTIVRAHQQAAAASPPISWPCSASQRWRCGCL